MRQGYKVSGGSPEQSSSHPQGTDASLDLRKKAKLTLESQQPAEVLRRKDNTRSTAIVKDFTQWLQTMRGKQKSKRSASQHASQALGDEVSESASEDLELSVITTDNKLQSRHPEKLLGVI